MTGYTPLFSSLTTGTLCGRWPDVGLWPIVLSLADRHGIVDVTPAYIARVTGLVFDEVVACMKRFCEPDSDSRSSADGGARLTLIDPQHRDWGWSVVNHGTYRERARLSAKNLAEVESGKNRGRMEDRRGPPDTAGDPPSDSDKTKQDKEHSRRLAPTVPAFHQEVIEAYHELCPALPRVKDWSKPRCQALEARIRERCKAGKPANQITYWREVFTEVSSSDFLTGRSKPDFRASLEWLLRPANFLKVIEGNYTSRRTNGAP